MRFSDFAMLLLGSGQEVRIYAFNDEDGLDEFVKTGSYENTFLLFVHESSYAPSVTLRDEFCNADVITVCVIAKDTLAVLLDIENIPNGV